MKSPFTGGNLILKQEVSELTFRKEKFPYVYQFYECEDTKERLTTTELDEINLSQVYNRYRVKYGIPFPDEIRQIRHNYELSAAKMSEILGFGDNQYRLYENGDMPSEANGKILSSIKEPSIFKVFVENAKNQFSNKDYEKILLKLKRATENGQAKNIKEELIFESYGRSIVDGYAQQSYDRLRNIILYLIDKCSVTYTTKMNKLLFYVDFLSYKRYGRGMTGLAYKAIQFGPVPVRWDRVYSLIDDISMDEVVFPSGHYGTQLSSALLPDNTILSQEDLIILETIVEKFGDMPAAQLSALSHQEDAWKKYHDTSRMIDYTEAFTLHSVT
jgi:uncharacterized phage-associated protein/DNA-binding transcriptional regulator YiaG